MRSPSTGGELEGGGGQSTVGPELISVPVVLSEGWVEGGGSSSSGVRGNGRMKTGRGGYSQKGGRGVGGQSKVRKGVGKPVSSQGSGGRVEGGEEGLTGGTSSILGGGRMEAGEVRVGTVQGIGGPTRGSPGKSKRLVEKGLAAGAGLCCGPEPARVGNDAVKAEGGSQVCSPGDGIVFGGGKGGKGSPVLVAGSEAHSRGGDTRERGRSRGSPGKGKAITREGPLGGRKVDGGRSGRCGGVGRGTEVGSPGDEGHGRRDRSRSPRGARRILLGGEGSSRAGTGGTPGDRALSHGACVARIQQALREEGGIEKGTEVGGGRGSPPGDNSDL